MLPGKSIVLVFLAMMLIVQGQSHSGDSIAVFKPPQELRLTIKSTKPVVIPGQAIILSIQATNISKQKLCFVETHPAQDFRIQVRDSRGRLRPLTEAGRMKAAGIAYRRIMAELLPGKAMTYTLTVNHYVDMKVPGTYTLFLERDFAVGDNRKRICKTARSNSIEVTVRSR